jgi:glycosyltransferase involved in cell wall biosynthesis
MKSIKKRYLFTSVYDGDDSVDFAFACDVMMDLGGSIRPAMYLANELISKGHKVSVISPLMSEFVEEGLRASGIEPINLRAKLVVKNLGSSLLWLEAWAREAFLGLNSRHLHNGFYVLNFSQVISAPSLVWYLQGPPSIALKDVEKEMPVGFRIAYNVLKYFIEYADERLVSHMGEISQFIIANSKYCASMYSSFGVKSNDLIYPPIDCKIFQPSTANPSSDYVLTYFGKETKISVIKKVASMGIKVKAFGAKMEFLDRKVVGHPNIELLGRLSSNELVDAYSNALFTLFPFTHEPFGYVPLESMACGTPALTHNLQGPSEYVIDGQTGWLAQSDDEVVQKAMKLWKEGYPPRMRANCVKEVLKFDKRFYLEKWLKVLDGLCGGQVSLR